MNPNPIGSMTGSMRYDTPHCSSAATLGSRVSSPWPKSGITTTRARPPARSRATSRLAPLTLKTSSAPEPTHDVRQIRELASRRAADVDDVGAACTIVFGLPANRVAREPRRVVHFGHDLHVVRAVVAPGGRAP